MNTPGWPESLSDLRALTRTALDAVLTGDQQPVAVVHPLEFVCIPILRSPGFGVCGHIWENSRSAPTIHCHSWHLNSEVVAGAVLNEVFAIADHPGSDHHLLSIDSTGPFDRISPTGRTVVLQDETRTLHRMGTTYSLRAGAFHRSTPVSAGPTLTLLAATAVAGARDQIVATRSSQPQAIRREELSARAARTMAELLRSAIDTPSPLNQIHEPAGTPPRKSPVPDPQHRAGRT